jgi:hypothetical protein
MTTPVVVGVLGARIVSEVAAAIGYGNRELDLYPTGCIEPICDAGMLPIGVPSADVASGLDWCDLVSAFVLPHDGREDAGANGLPIVMAALARHLPVLAIGSGERLLAAALADYADAPSEGRGPDLAEILGVSGGRQVPVLTETTSVPSGMRAAARRPGGSVYALAIDAGPVGPALSIRWDPSSLAPGDEARDGPFRWLRDHAASPRPSAQRGRQEHPSAREEVT